MHRGDGVMVVRRGCCLHAPHERWWWWWWWWCTGHCTSVLLHACRMGDASGAHLTQTHAPYTGHCTPCSRTHHAGEEGARVGSSYLVCRCARRGRGVHSHHMGDTSGTHIAHTGRATVGTCCLSATSKTHRRIQASSPYEGSRKRGADEDGKGLTSTDEGGGWRGVAVEERRVTRHQANPNSHTSPNAPQSRGSHNTSHST